jgi:hypothetical protein
MFGSLLPDWIGDAVTLIAVALGLPGIILHLLSRKGANRKLQIDEGGLSVQVFNAQNAGYKDLLDRAERTAREATGTVEEFKTELRNVNNRLNKMYAFLSRIIYKNDIELNDEEKAEFEAVNPFRDENSPIS